MKKHLIILNPSAAKGTALSKKTKIEALLQQHGLDYTFIVSEKPGDPALLAQEAGDKGYDIVVAVGGDGTANEVINGLMLAKLSGRAIPAMGVIPAGRGNDFAASMGIPAQIPQAVQAIADGRSRLIDIGQLTGGDDPQGKYFGNGIGIGFDTVVGFEAAKLPAFLSGTPGYLIAALKTIFLYYKAHKLRIVLDQETIEQPCLIVSVMNGKRMGTSFMMAPGARQDDGLFNVMIIGQVSRFGIIKLMGKIMAGKQEGQPFVKMPLTSTLEITALTGSLPVHADGETICRNGRAISVRMFPEQIALIVEDCNSHA
ncbi:MAG: diacylglycerol kinase family lipid kinase [Ruminococcaceae bacterium]|jgi:YegS/Rv2252/BmrU family lipid kinase|nr:diacylglycerol kinase family lipid kinase [Oscillospiraceae bacterium]